MAAGRESLPHLNRIMTGTRLISALRPNVPGGRTISDAPPSAGTRRLEKLAYTTLARFGNTLLPGIPTPAIDQRDTLRRDGGWRCPRDLLGFPRDRAGRGGRIGDTAIGVVEEVAHCRDERGGEEDPDKAELAERGDCHHQNGGVQVGHAAFKVRGDEPPDKL